MTWGGLNIDFEGGDGVGSGPMRDFVLDFDEFRLDTFFGFSCDGYDNFVDIIFLNKIK